MPGRVDTIGGVHINRINAVSRGIARKFFVTAATSDSARGSVLIMSRRVGRARKETCPGPRRGFVACELGRRALARTRACNRFHGPRGDHRLSMHTEWMRDRNWLLRGNINSLPVDAADSTPPR